VHDMKIIRSYSEAKQVLTREIPAEFTVSHTGQGERNRETGTPVEQIVSDIIREVRQKGDLALLDYARKFDKAELNSLLVTSEEITAAYKQVDEQLKSALLLAAKRITDFQTICKGNVESYFLSNGAGRTARPLSKVGLYVPGGTAAYPSTMLMSALPARVAGVEKVIVTTPPRKDGTIHPATLIAADMAKVDLIFKTGGAQAVAALAFGTESIPKVDKICGPGNIFVAKAKQMVYGIVDIDGIQGPSEIAVVADDTADASFCAADLIAQSEHDTMAISVFITTSGQLADNVCAQINAQLEKLERKAIAEKALGENGIIAIVDTIDEAIELVNRFAPEHLSLMIRDAQTYIDRIRNAGCILINQNSPVTIGDYIAGPSHVLPTSGTARFSSSLSVEDFYKFINIISLDEKEFETLGPATIIMAESEGLTGHAQAIRIRLQSNNKGNNP
jgi:histidinol dehydrogenase